MSLLRRVERIQQEQARQQEESAGSAMVPVAPPPASTPVATVPHGTGMTARESMIREIKLRLQPEVVKSFDSLLDVSADEVSTKIGGIVDRVLAANGFAVTHDERLRLIEELVGEVNGLGPLEPLLQDDTITEVMVNGPRQIYIERKGKIERVDAAFLSDEHVLRIIDRIVTPLGRRIDMASPRVDARLPDGSRVNAIIPPLVARRAGDHDPQVLADPYTVGRPGRVRDGDARDVRLPQGVRRGTAQHVRLGRHRLGQDDDAQRPVLVHPQRRADRDDRGRGGAPAPAGARDHPGGAAAEPRGSAARSRSATCSATRSTCGRTGSSSASAVAARRWT